jgi:hypothetical protein
MSENNTQLAKNKMNADMYLPTTKSEAYKLSESFAQSSFCPAAYKGKPAEVYLAMAYGSQIGLNPLLAVQNIAVVNGKPSVYGDALTAIAQGHHETKVYQDGYKEDGTAFCHIVRESARGTRDIYREFSVEDAKTAGLWGQNTWKKYPQRMLLWRARGWAIRDAFADVLMGLWSTEEALDAPDLVERVVTPENEPETPENGAQSTKADKIKAKVKKEEPEPQTAPIFEEDEEPEEGQSSDGFFFGEDE